MAGGRPGRRRPAGPRARQGRPAQDRWDWTQGRFRYYQVILNKKSDRNKTRLDGLVFNLNYNRFCIYVVVLACPLCVFICPFLASIFLARRIWIMKQKQINLAK